MPRPFNRRKFIDECMAAGDSRATADSYADDYVVARNELSEILSRHGGSIDRLPDETVDAFFRELGEAGWPYGRDHDDATAKGVLERDVAKALHTILQSSTEPLGATEDSRILSASLAAKVAQSDENYRAANESESGALPPGSTEAERLTHFANALIDNSFGGDDA